MTTVAPEAQAVLFPETPAGWTFLRLTPDLVPPDAELLGPDPDPEMIASVAEHGVLQPLDVTPAPDDKPYAYVVHGGTRRVKALRRVREDWARRHPGQDLPEHLLSLPAQQPDRPMSQAELDVLMIQLHATRKPNMVADYRRAKYLLAQGLSEKEVARRVHISVTQLGRLLRLDALDPRLLEACEHGKISHGQAYDVLKLPKASQDRLAAVYAAKGKLAGEDVRAERQVDTQRTSEAMDWSGILATPATTGVEKAEPTAPADDADALGRLVTVLAEHLAMLGMTAVDLQPDDTLRCTFRDGRVRSLAFQVMLDETLPDVGEVDFELDVDLDLDGERREDVQAMAQMGPLPRARATGRKADACPHGSTPTDCGLDPCRTRRLDRERKRRARSRD